ncbi:hypothetical protein OEA41_004312 [Lepraria neglecta]|uniref:Uncharacterized protein n=1 Tax=Lepraria neglecta TaxID=209136 RepID=A0AAD9YXN5_9LECA|nr:hypothetical protein OEA41_004312 [Lepraria neglecta]
MPLDAATARELVKKLAEDKASYLHTVDQAHDVLAQALSSAAEESSASPIAATELLDPDTAATARASYLDTLYNQKKPPENSASLYDWLEWIYAESNETHPGSFVLWQVLDPKLHVESMYNVMDWYKILQPLPRQVERRNEIYRRALVYILSQAPSWQIPDTVVGDITSAKEPEQRKDRLKLPAAARTRVAMAENTQLTN